MSDQDAGTSTVSETNQEPGFLQNVVNLYFGPTEAFTAIVKRPSFWAALALQIAIGLGFTAIWVKKVDLHAFMEARLDESPRTAEMPGAQKAIIIDQQVKVVPIFAWLGPSVFGPLWMLIVSGVLLFVYRFFYSSDVNFRQAVAITTHTFLAVALVTVPLMWLVLTLKDDWTLNPQEVLQANLTLALDRQTTARPLYSLAGSLDLFSLWTVWLLATGFGVASRKTPGAALAGVLVPWALIALIKAAFSLLF